jgi:Ca2+/Na+ antiporter
VVPAVTSVVLGNIDMVCTSLALGSRWGISQLVIGTVVLASLTGLPNVLASVRLGVEGVGEPVAPGPGRRRPAALASKGGRGEVQADFRPVA